MPKSIMAKSALDLLTAYGGDSSDDEVPGTRVSTKRMFKDDEDESNYRKRIQRLPVPECFAKKSQHIEENVEDSSLHEGRKRSFPHERGNWATYIYIPFELNEGLEKLIATIINEIPLEMKSFQEFHLSLTRTVILKHHWIDSFISTIKNNIICFKKFVIMFGSLEVYCNDEKTRTFVGMKAKTGVDTLLQLVHNLDNSLEEFNLPPFYQDPSFHISIAWCIGDHRENLKSLLPDLNHHIQNVLKDFSQDCWYKYVEDILCKTGNKIYQFHLS